MADEKNESGLYFVEDEQTEKIKRWWKANGIAVIVGLLIGIGSVAGYQGWRIYQNQQFEVASDLYQRMIRQSDSEKITEVRQSANQLISKYGSTTYADTASLMLARLEVEEGNPELADAHLDRVIEGSDDAALRQVARLRLASLALDRDELERAQQILSIKEMEGFESQYFEILGDILMASDNVDGANRAYQQAMDNAVAGSVGYQMLDRKLNNTKRAGNDR